MSYIKAYEYQSSVNPILEQIPILSKNYKKCNYGITTINLSQLYNVNFEATSPNLLASFLKIENNKEFIFENNDSFNASSHLFYVIEGEAKIIIDHLEEYNISEGYIVVLPYFTKLVIINQSNNDFSSYYINDSPLLNYIGTIPNKKIFKTSIYSKDFIFDNLIKLSDPSNNRKGILLGNEDTELLGIKTISHILWSLYNEVPPKTDQRPHKHNSVALDYCIYSPDETKVYTLIGEELDENNNIINPKKIYWKTGSMFITPPGLWHSHHNETHNKNAYVLPIQDAGLLLYQRILGIVLK